MRIVAGRWKGRPLTAPRGVATRPTSDRVREAAFDAMLARVGTLEGVSVLDVFAGTGAMGLEALSRGASLAVFVEDGKAALEVLRKNISSLHAEGCTRVVDGDARGGTLDRALSFGPFALLVLDPPYRIDQSVPLDVVRRASRALAQDAMVVWEHAASTPAPRPEGWRPLRTYRHGDTHVTFLAREGEGDT